ncbi:SRPBCC family protein [Sphingobium yanoikuyae]|jgi:uncharacterized membrane protein|uniref:Cyclase n=1 Tax=Sphingobium yanoikuyae TaxID=13690 RepID=A0A0J9FQ12_SPHYA|nr:SRPBCC family protein [Sphingobium yanoikuyae]ATP17958.1 cyclase [Sphingobium yanoikuyae]KMW30430.1 cyclase [Sphingobium yanoikuyae]
MSHATDDADATAAKSIEQKKEAATAIEGAGHESYSGKSVTINRPRADLFAYWRDFTQLPSFMDNVERVEILATDRSHWVVKAPAGKVVEWDAIITEEIDGELIAWASVEGADVTNSGRIEFRDAGERGTIVTATIAYDPPAGFIGKIVAKMFQREPAIQARRDLRRFKQLMETGEVATAARTAQQFAEEKN